MSGAMGVEVVDREIGVKHILGRDSRNRRKEADDGAKGSDDLIVEHFPSLKAGQRESGGHIYRFPRPYRNDLR